MFYRGADLRSLNQNEFRDDAIQGEAIPVYKASLPETESAEDYQNQDIENIAPFIEQRDSVSITGGLTGKLSAAIKFTKRTFPPGLVLVMDETNIPAEVERVEYTPEWFDAHPGVLAHVTTLHDGELRSDGDITALVSARDDQTVISEPRRTEIENEATASRYASEEEMVAFAPEVWLDSSVTDMAAYLGTSGVSPYTIPHALAESPNYRSSLGTIKDLDTREVVAQEDEYRKQAEALYDEMMDYIEYRDVPFHIVAVESRNDVGTNAGYIERDNFRFVYDGSSFSTNYDRHSALLGVS